jgi:hypothetical protein
VTVSHIGSSIQGSNTGTSTWKYKELAYIVRVLKVLVPCSAAYEVNKALTQPGNPYCTGRLGTVDLLVLTSSFYAIYFRHKTSYLNEEFYCTESVVPVSTHFNANI